MSSYLELSTRRRSRSSSRRQPLSPRSSGKDKYTPTYNHNDFDDDAADGIASTPMQLKMTPLSPRSMNGNNVKSSAQDFSMKRSRSLKKTIESIGGAGGTFFGRSRSRTPSPQTDLEEGPATDENLAPSLSPPPAVAMKKKRSFKVRLGRSRSKSKPRKPVRDVADVEQVPLSPASASAAVIAEAAAAIATADVTANPSTDAGDEDANAGTRMVVDSITTQNDSNHEVEKDLSSKTSSVSITTNMQRSTKSKPYVPLHVRLRERQRLEKKKKKIAAKRSGLPPLDPNSKKTQDTQDVQNADENKESEKEEEHVMQEEEVGPVSSSSSPFTDPSANSVPVAVGGGFNLLPEIDGLCSVIEMECGMASKEMVVLDTFDEDMSMIESCDDDNDLFITTDRDNKVSSLVDEKVKPEGLDLEEEGIVKEEKADIGNDAKQEISQVAKTSPMWSNLCITFEAIDSLLSSSVNVCFPATKPPVADEGAVSGSTDHAIDHKGPVLEEESIMKSEVLKRASSTVENKVPFTNSWPLTAADANTKAVEEAHKQELNKTKELADIEMQRVRTDAEEKIKSYMDQLEQIEKKFETENLRNEALSAQVEKLKQLMHKVHDDQMEVAAKREVEEVCWARAEAEAKSKKLASDLDAETKANRELKSNIIELKRYISHTKRAPLADENKEEMERIKEQAEREILARTNELKATEEKLLNASKQNSALKAHIARLTQEIDSATERQQALNVEVHRFKEQAIAQSLAQREELQGQLMNASVQNGALKEQVAKLTQDICIVQMNAQKTIEAQNDKLERMGRAIKGLQMGTDEGEPIIKDKYEQNNQPSHDITTGHQSPRSDAQGAVDETESSTEAEYSFETNSNDDGLLSGWTTTLSVIESVNETNTSSLGSATFEKSDLEATLTTSSSNEPGSWFGGFTSFVKNER